MKTNYFIQNLTLCSILFIVCFCYNPIFAQVAINTDGTPPDGSAMLDVQSTEKGFLPPRMTEDNMNSIADPSDGLIVYNTDEGKLFIYVSADVVWKELTYKDEITQPLQIGDFYGGGIIFYLDETGHHGLVCAKEDQSTGIKWSGTIGTHDFAYGSSIYDGEMNTINIMAHHIAIYYLGAYAAVICVQYEEFVFHEGGYTRYGGWYLPSYEELRLMWWRRSDINSTATANGGTAFTPGKYWSSSEFNINEAYYRKFPGGFSFHDYKDVPLRVRAIRAF